MRNTTLTLNNPNPFAIPDSMPAGWGEAKPVTSPFRTSRVVCMVEGGCLRLPIRHGLWSQRAYRALPCPSWRVTGKVPGELLPKK